MTLLQMQCHQGFPGLKGSEIFLLMTDTVFERLTGLEPPFKGISEFICELLDVVSER